MPRRHILVPLIASLLALPSASRGAEDIEEAVQAILQTPGYEHARWGLLVADRGSGEVLYERNANALFCPASVTKLFSGSAALAGLGPDYRFQTTVKRTKEVGKDGALLGDLIVVASGDFSLGGRTSPDGNLLFTSKDHSYAGGTLDTELVSDDPLAPLAGLDSLAREIAKAGIKTVNDVIIDDRLFDAAQSTGSGPSRVSPIVINDNVIDVVVTPAGKAGEPATIRVVPRTDYLSIDAQVETTAEETSPRVQVTTVGPRRILVRGRLPVGHKPVVKIHEVREPADFARALFIETLRRHAVQVEASPLGTNAATRLPSRAEVEALAKVAEYTSPPFREYLKVILKVSQNLHASTLPMLLAAKAGERTLEAGLKRQGEQLKQLGVDINAVSFGGGAGGSRSDLVTPRATVGLLRHLATRPDFAAFEAALPVLGRDGTLHGLVADESPARGRVRAKTGTYWVGNGLNGKAVLTSKALAGTIETASGRQLAFAFFVNDVPLDAASEDVSAATTKAGRLLAQLCELFYNDKPPATAAAGDEEEETAVQAPESETSAGGG